MANERIIAIINADLDQVQHVIDELGLDARAKQVGRYVAAYGPFLDELGADGVAEVARSKKLPLVEVKRQRRDRSTNASNHQSHAAL
jgi:hypothetical protein